MIMSVTANNSDKTTPMKFDGNIASQAFCLRWNNFQSNMLNVFERLFLDERFVDVTLACDGQLIKAHKMVLSASSSYFHEIFTTTPCPHPVIILKDIPLKDLRKILEFMYKGEINVCKQEISSLLAIAETLHVRGLAQIDTNNDEPQSFPSNVNISNGNQVTTTLNQLLKRTNARQSSIDSLVLIEDDVAQQPTKQIKLTNDTNTKFVMAPQQSQPQLQDNSIENATYSSTNDTEHDAFENTTEYDDAVESIQIKEEGDDEGEDIISNYITDTRSFEGFHWMDPNVHSISSEPVETDGNKGKTAVKKSESTKLKAPSWTADQLREAIESVVTQKMRFTQASMKYNIPKGTLYDNILGKSNRMEVLAKSGLNANDENTVLEYCCDLSASPYNRRTRKPLSEILQFVYRLGNCNHQVFDENNRFAYRWWWAFCKKYSIVSLHYDNNANIKMTERN
ncbi:zinc finger protein 131-like [Contarinia nasturtii]|uniref:zinc finger protein 131-like n=1 Tax=Contarinia nasturtii TaxID=265458 RepID=UPI0012D49DCC|nr:zinc finger protein 131-like [Contarinia nasturtii]XP_031629992.1 zinc finger protein 131-like [Contarinia nasturtii]XP_031629994.1 zinc finger protein 131-like [Contarinia nasturtii]XP_031629995.1 zinc finger protein 131-like [Contarinia nasturtii]